MGRRGKELEIYKKNGQTKTDRRENFYFGVLALSLSAIIVKIIGLVYKIPMLRLLGSEGMGYFNCAYEIYALLCVISTSGLPVAMSVMISKGKEDAREKVFKTAMRLFLLLGLLGTALMLCLSFPLARLLGSDKSFYSILSIAPTLLFICVTSAYRGYFQGLSRMSPTAISQIIEAIGKLLLGILFALAALNAGFSVELVAAFAVLGLVVGSAISMLYLMIMRKHALHENIVMLRQENRSITSELCRTAIPISLSAAVLSITKMIDMTMILRCLQGIGYSSEEAFSMYGSYTTLCLPLFSLAPALVSSVALPIIPKLSRAISQGDGNLQAKTVNEGILVTNIISMPIASGLALYSKEILSLIFKGESESIELCAPLLSVLALSVALSSLVTLSNAVLQAYGNATLPMLSMGIGAVVKIAVAFVMIGNKNIGIMGAPISTFFCDLIIVIVNFYFVCMRVPKNLNIGTFLRPFSAAVLSVGVSKFLYGTVSFENGESAMLTLSFIGLSAIIYAFMCMLFKVINIKEILKINKADA